EGEEGGVRGGNGKGESVKHFETIRGRKDGSCLPISVTISPIRNKTGVITGASKIARDISDRKRVEAQAERAHRQTDFVARMAEVFSRSLDYEARLRRIPELAVPSLADWPALDILDGDGRIRRLAVAHADPAKNQLDSEVLEQYEDPLAPFSVRRIIRTGKSTLLTEVTDDLIVAAARGRDDRIGLMRALGFVS